MLRQLNDGIKALLKEIQAKLEGLVNTARSEDELKTLSERYSLFHGLCNESLKFNEAFVVLLDWMESNTKHFVYASVTQMENKLGCCIDLFQSYLEKDIDDLSAHFDKAKILQDADVLHRMRDHVLAVNAVLTHDGTAQRERYFGLLKERIEIAQPSGPLGFLGIFGTSKQHPAETAMAGLMSVLLGQLEAGPEKTVSGELTRAPAFNNGGQSG